MMTQEAGATVFFYSGNTQHEMITLYMNYHIFDTFYSFFNPTKFTILQCDEAHLSAGKPYCILMLLIFILLQTQIKELHTVKYQDGKKYTYSVIAI